MSKDLSPTELRVCRLGFAFLAVIVFAFLLLNAIEPLSNPSPTMRKAEVQSDITNSTGRSPKQSTQSSHRKQTTGAQSEKEPQARIVPEEPAQVSLLHMKARLEQLGSMALQKAIQFDSEPLERRLDANTLVVKDAVPRPTGNFKQQWKEKIVTANASTEPPLLEPGQEAKVTLPERLTPTPQGESNEASLDADALLQIKSRLRDLGFLSSTKTGGWDASTRNALRDFKVANHLANDDQWNHQTNKKLNSQAAIRADHSIIGTWSTTRCRSSAMTTDIRLSINSRRAKSSAGSVCEFHDLQANNREWRVRATCSQGDQRWPAKGKFALKADKLVWTSDSDVISYFRCN
jgi:hypothetical protein